MGQQRQHRAHGDVERRRLRHRNDCSRRQRQLSIPVGRQLSVSLHVPPGDDRDDHRAIGGDGLIGLELDDDVAERLVANRLDDVRHGLVELHLVGHFRAEHLGLAVGPLLQLGVVQDD